MLTPTIEVSELYIAPQGEGTHLGRMSLFLRLRRCVLSCSWCDSKNTWDKNDSEYGTFKTFTVPELVDHMRILSPAVQALVVTGGEPLIWQRVLPAVLVSYRAHYQVPVEIETSGTIVPSTMLLRACHFNVSHKLASAANKVAQHRLWRSDALVEMLRQARIQNLTFKPVVDPAVDRLSLIRYLSWLVSTAQSVGVSSEKILSCVYLMPQARTRAELIHNQPWVNELAERYHVNATTRAQILTYNDERRR